MKRWEYRSFMFGPGDTMLKKLNELGAEGWEAFHFFRVGPSHTRVMLKREVPS